MPLLLRLDEMQAVVDTDCVGVRAFVRLKDAEKHSESVHVGVLPPLTDSDARLLAVDDSDCAGESEGVAEPPEEEAVAAALAVPSGTVAETVIDCVDEGGAEEEPQPVVLIDCDGETVCVSAAETDCETLPHVVGEGVGDRDEVALGIGLAEMDRLCTALCVDDGEGETLSDEEPERSGVTEAEWQLLAHCVADAVTDMVGELLVHCDTDNVNDRKDEALGIGLAEMDRLCAALGVDEGEDETLSDDEPERSGVTEAEREPLVHCDGESVTEAVREPLGVELAEVEKLCVALCDCEDEAVGLKSNTGAVPNSSTKPSPPAAVAAPPCALSRGAVE